VFVVRIKIRIEGEKKVKTRMFNECRNIDFGINRFLLPPTHEISVI